MISSKVVILTEEEFEKHKAEAFARGVVRGKFESVSSDFCAAELSRISGDEQAERHPTRPMITTAFAAAPKYGMDEHQQGCFYIGFYEGYVHLARLLIAGSRSKS